MFCRLRFALLMPTLLSTLLVFTACKNSKDSNHQTTLKLAQPVTASIKLVSKTDEILKLKPVIKANTEPEKINIKWLLTIEDEEPQTLFIQDFEEVKFAPEKLQEVEVFTSPGINHKVVLIVEGVANGKEFSLSKIYNSEFQEELNEAKKNLQERSQNYNK